MHDLFPPWPFFSAFLLASLVLALTPGPGVLYIVTRSLAQGRRAGLLSAAGIALGNLGNALAASVGLASIFEASSTAFTVVKLAGALYLIYLGARMLLISSDREAIVTPASAAPGRVFRDGFVIALLNPKTTVFFAAFLPQFFSPAVPAMLQGMVLGTLFVAIAAVTDIFYAVAAGTASQALHAGRLQRLFRQSAGGIFISFGLFTALVDAQPRGR